MATWRTLGVVALALAAAAPLSAQTYSLTEAPQPGDCARVHMEMTLAGEMRVNRDGKPTPIKLSASANHEYSERVLEIGSAGWPIKNARHYDAAQATITAGADRTTRKLRAGRGLIVAQICKEQFLSYCPDGPLTREELDLTSEHLDTLAITGLLPTKAVGIGETWKLSNSVVQAMCAFEGLIKQDLTCKLEAVQGDVARVSIQGPANGIDLGAMVKLTVDATCRYDLKQKAITGLEWKQKDEREQGPANPATTVETTTTVARAALAEQPKELGDAALNAVPSKSGEPPAENLLLYYKEPTGRYTLTYGREWQTVAQTEEHLVLRLMDRGEFVAQVTVTPWDKAAAGKHMTGEELQKIMDDVPGWSAAGGPGGGEVKADQDGYWIYRISALGELDEMKVMQNYFVVAGPNGDQVLLAFTMKQSVVDRLGTRDLELAQGIEFAEKK